MRLIVRMNCSHGLLCPSSLLSGTGRNGDGYEAGGLDALLFRWEDGMHTEPPGHDLAIITEFFGDKQMVGT